jgi:hypothetical protein
LLKELPTRKGVSRVRKLGEKLRAKERTAAEEGGKATVLRDAMGRVVNTPPRPEEVAAMVKLVRGL